jgi:hypothetical protein
MGESGETGEVGDMGSETVVADSGKPENMTGRREILTRRGRDGADMVG